MSSNFRQLVRERAGRRCEYCRFQEDHLPLWPFHLDHIVAKQHGGSDDLSNLAWSCHRCNLQKGTNLTARDPDSTSIVPLFNPRTERWEAHYAVQEGRLVGRSLRRMLVEEQLW
jgi:5-methylcytosine-specific restriction endonuclease McrA